jgi:hypothetical protein
MWSIFVGRRICSSAGPRKYGSYFRRPRDRRKCGVFSWAGAVRMKISHRPTEAVNRGPKSSRSRACSFSLALARFAVLNHRAAARRAATPPHAAPPRRPHSPHRASHTPAPPASPHARTPRRAARTPLVVPASSSCPIPVPRPALPCPPPRRAPSPHRPSPCPPPRCAPSARPALVVPASSPCPIAVTHRHRRLLAVPPRRDPSPCRPSPRPALAVPASSSCPIAENLPLRRHRQ